MEDFYHIRPDYLFPGPQLLQVTNNEGVIFPVANTQMVHSLQANNVAIMQPNDYKRVEIDGLPEEIIKSETAFRKYQLLLENDEYMEEEDEEEPPLRKEKKRGRKHVPHPRSKVRAGLASTPSVSDMLDRATRRKFVLSAFYRLSASKLRETDVSAEEIISQLVDITPRHIRRMVAKFELNNFEEVGYPSQTIKAPPSQTTLLRAPFA